MTYKIIKTGSRLKERQTRRLVLVEQAALVNNYAGSGDLQSPLVRQDVNPFYDIRSKVLSPRASSLFFINNYARSISYASLDIRPLTADGSQLVAPLYLSGFLLFFLSPRAPSCTVQSAYGKYEKKMLSCPFPFPPQPHNVHGKNIP